MEVVSAKLLTAVGEVSRLLSVQLLRHGVSDVLLRDVLHSTSSWLPAAGASVLKRMLVPSSKQAAWSSPDTLLEQLPALHLSDDKLDAAFTTLRLLNKRLTALSTMAHEPNSTSTTHDVSINAQSWLVAHKAEHMRQYWQYGYSLTFENMAEEPLQLLRKAWTVQDITGCSRHRESVGLLGLQPIIEPFGRLSCKTAITLNSIKGSMEGCFELRGVKSGQLIKATVPAFALTPSALQLSDAQPAYACEAVAAP